MNEHTAENDARPFTHLGVTHPNGDQCIWIDGDGWFVPLDAGGEGYDCPHEHPVTEKDALAALRAAQPTEGEDPWRGAHLPPPVLGQRDYVEPTEGKSDA